MEEKTKGKKKYPYNYEELFLTYNLRCIYPNLN